MNRVSRNGAAAALLCAMASQSWAQQPADYPARPIRMLVGFAARSAPDGYTISMISASTTIPPSVYTNVPYDIASDFSHVSVLASGAFVVVVNPALPGYEATGWYGVVAPARTPAPPLTRLHQEIVKVLALADVREQLARFDIEPVASSPEQMTKLIKSELVKWADVARDEKLARGSIQ